MTAMTPNRSPPRFWTAQLQQLRKIRRPVAGYRIPSLCGIPARERHDRGGKFRISVGACASRRAPVHDVIQAFVAHGVEPGVEEAEGPVAAGETRVVQEGDDGGEGWRGGAFITLAANPLNRKNSMGVRKGKIPSAANQNVLLRRTPFPSYNVIPISLCRHIREPTALWIVKALPLIT